MQTTVKLQEMFTYSAVPLIVTAVFVVLITFYLIYLIKIKWKIGLKVLPERTARNKNAIKERYLRELDKIEYKYEKGEITLRKAYQMMSLKVREFVFEAFNINAQNYTLSEIQKLNIPILYELIERYYKPEFSNEYAGDFKTDINKTRGAINKWK